MLDQLEMDQLAKIKSNRNWRRRWQRCQSYGGIWSERALNLSLLILICRL